MGEGRPIDKALEEAIEFRRLLDDLHPKALAELVYKLIESGERIPEKYVREAIAQFSSARNLFGPEDPHDLELAADLLVYIGDYKKAIKYYKENGNYLKALRLARNTNMSKRFTEKLYREAMKYYEEIINFDRCIEIAEEFGMKEDAERYRRLKELLNE